MQLQFQSNFLSEKQEALLRQHQEGLPDNFFRDLMNDQLGRGYLNHLPSAENWIFPEAEYAIRQKFSWIRFSRLPIKPGREEENTLLESWQSVLSACHTMNLRIAFVLSRHEGETALYLGAIEKTSGEENFATEKLRQCMAIHMSGAEFTIPETIRIRRRNIEEVDYQLSFHERAGIVTGIPSLRNERGGVTLQTLDKIAKGIRIGESEKNYALIVLADPAPDAEIAELIQALLELKSEIHQCFSYRLSETSSESKGNYGGFSFNVGVIFEALTVASLLTGNPIAATGFAAVTHFLPASQVGLYRGKTQSQSSSTGLNTEYLDYTVKYCENLIDKNIARLERGRNLGFWQTGVYVMAEDDVTTNAVLGMIRSVYSGRESYVEPIRVFNVGANEQVRDFIGGLNFLPLPEIFTSKEKIREVLGLDGGWHVLGRMYENLTTAMTTEELSIASSLPRREVPGLRLVKNAVSFSSNSSNVVTNCIEMGKLVDMGVVQNKAYRIEKNSLVRHLLVGGITGSGKSTTCKKIINGVRKQNIPVMIIEPAKDDYVRWAIEQNKFLPERDRYTIIMPGVTKIEGVEPAGLYLNLFKPASYYKAPVNLVQHAEMMVTLLNAALPSEEVVPLLIEEAVHAALQQAAETFNIDLNKIENPQLEIYPMISELMEAGEKIIERKTYEKRIKDGYKEVLNTRFKYLARGTRGQILDVPTSTNFETLFNQSVVINLSRLSGTKDKSLIMSLVLLALQEYRVSKYQYDAAYRARAQQNELMHLVVLEEAHNVLTKPTILTSGNPQQAAAQLFGNMLSEIRSYGQGMMIVDQVPTRLIEDAVKNTNYKIAHRMIAPDDVELMASSMLLRRDQTEIIPALGIGDAVICGDMDDMASWVKINPSFS